MFILYNWLATCYNGSMESYTRDMSLLVNLQWDVITFMSLLFALAGIVGSFLVNGRMPDWPWYGPVLQAAVVGTFGGLLALLILYSVQSLSTPAYVGVCVIIALFSSIFLSTLKHLATKWRPNRVKPPDSTREAQNGSSNL